MKHCLTSTALAFMTLAFVSSQAEINWASDTSGGYLLRDADNTVLTAGTSATGFMAQLIQIVGGGGILPASDSTVTGAQGPGNVVVDVAWLGASAGFGGTVNGRLHLQIEPTHLDGGRYFVRVWNAPAGGSTTLNDGNELAPRPIMVAGLNALGKPLRYGDSQIFTATGDNTIVNPFTFQATTNQLFPGAVPEPGTAGLLGLGLVLLRRTLRRKSA